MFEPEKWADKVQTLLVLICINIAVFILLAFLFQCDAYGERIPNKELLPGGPGYGVNWEKDNNFYDRRGIATVFGGRKDKWRGGRSSCIIPRRRITRYHWGIAHRYWPCGTVVVICNQRTNRCTVARVIDHGPYPIERCPGKKARALKGKRRRRPGCRVQRAGIADLTFPVARSIGHNGKEKVTLWRITE